MTLPASLEIGNWRTMLMCLATQSWTSVGNGGVSFHNPSARGLWKLTPPLPTEVQLCVAKHINIVRQLPISKLAGSVIPTLALGTGQEDYCGFVARSATMKR